jgi:hypothetical protein
MAKFDVEAYKTIYLNLLLEADTKEDAERLAREQIKEWTDLNCWKEYPTERGFYVHELKGPE